MHISPCKPRLEGFLLYAAKHTVSLGSHSLGLRRVVGLGMFRAGANRRRLAAELANGRLAMMAIIGGSA